GLEHELLDERLGDGLPALPEPGPAGHDVEDALDRGEVDDGVVALVLDLGEGAAHLVAPPPRVPPAIRAPRPPLLAHGTPQPILPSVAIVSPSRSSETISSHISGLMPRSATRSRTRCASGRSDPLSRSVQETRRFAMARRPGRPGRPRSSWWLRTASTMPGGRLHASSIQPPTSAWSTPKHERSI